jgi:hypothetical protein
MAETSKDIRLLISGELKNARAFKETAALISDLTDEIGKQAQAASRGEASMERLAEAVAELKQAGDSLVAAQGLVDSLRKTDERLVKAAASAEKAQKRFEEFAEKLKGAETVTQAQSDKLARLETAAQKTTTSLANLTRIAAEQRAGLVELGLSADHLAENTEQIVTSARQAGEALASVTKITKDNTEAAREYQGQLQRAAEIRKQQATADEQAARNEQVSARRRVADMESILRANQSSFNDFLAQEARGLQMQERSRAAAREAAEAFRQAGEKAIASARGYTTLADASSRLGPAMTAAAAGVGNILDKASEERKTLSGLEQQLTGLTQVVEGIKGPLKDYEVTLKSIGAIQSEIARKADLVDAFSNQVAAVRAARAEFVAARTEALRLGQAMAAATKPSDELAAANRKAQQNLASASRELTNQFQKAQQLRQTLQQAGLATNNLADTQRRLEAAARQTTTTAGRLTAAFEKHGRSTEGGALFGLSPYALQNLGYQINDVFTQLGSGASIMQTLAQQGGQILQIFPGAFAAIGTYALPLTAALAALVVVVGSLNRAAENAAALRQYSGTLALIPGSAGTTAASLVRVQREITNMGASWEDAGKVVNDAIERSFRPERIAEFAKYAQNLADIKPGLALTDAFKLVADAAQRGYPAVLKLQEATGLFTAAQMEALRAANEQGKALEEQRIVTEALGRTNEAAEKSTGAWTRAWRDFKSALDAVFERLSNTAPVQLAISAFNALAGAISTASRAVKNFVLPDAAASAQDALATAQKRLAEFDRNQAGTAFGGVATSPMAQRARARLLEDVAKAQEALNAAQKEGVKPAEDVTVATERQQAANQRALVATRRRIDGETDLTNEQKVQKAVREALAAAEAEGADAATKEEIARRAREAQEEENRTNDYKRNAAARATAAKDGANSARIEAAAIRARNAAVAEGVTSQKALREIMTSAREEERGRIAQERAGASAAKARLSQEQSVANQISSLIAAANRKDTQSLENRLAAVNEQYERIFRAIEKFRASGGSSISGVPLSQIEAQVRAQLTLLQQQETQKFYEQQMNELVQQRTALFRAVRDEQQSGLIDGATAIDRIRQISDDLAPRMRDIATQAVAFATSLKGAAPNPRLEAFLAQMRQAGGLTGGTAGPRAASAPSPTQQASTQAVGDSEREINRLFQERNATVSAFNNLVRDGTLSYTEAQTKIRAAYESSEPAIQQAISDFQKTNNSAYELGATTQSAFDLANAKIANFSSKVAYVDPQMQRIGKAIDDAFVNSAGTAIDSISQSIAGMIDGTMTAAEGFEAIGQAALQMGADILKAIAMAIVQEQALIAVQTIRRSLGAFHGGGLVGGTQGVRRTNIDPSVFAFAPRYHNGSNGPVGLRPDEQAAILQKGEEVLTADNPRNLANIAKGGGQAAGGGELAIRNVLVTDPNFVPDAMASSSGEKVIITAIRRNAPGIKQALGIR